MTDPAQFERVCPVPECAAFVPPGGSRVVTRGGRLPCWPDGVDQVDLTVSIPGCLERERLT